LHAAAAAICSVRIDEQRHADTRVGQLAAGGADLLEMARHVESAFGGDFLALLGHQADVLRLDRRQCRASPEVIAHSRVHARGQLRAQRAHVGVADMAAVFAQCSVIRSAGFLGLQRCLDRIGIDRAARIAQRGHVVDIDAEVDDPGFAWKIMPASQKVGYQRYCRSIRIWRVFSGSPCR
jgi:hypothetical protein